MGAMTIREEILPAAAPADEPPRGPHFRLVEPRGSAGDLEIVIAVVGGLAILGVAFAPLELLASLLGECRFHALFGIPCGSCGLTRAVVQLGRGDIAGALALNPLFVSAGLLFGLYVPVAWWLWLTRRRRPRFVLGSRRARWCGVAIAVVLFLVNWAYLIAAGV